MALIGCWECGKEKSDSAPICPHCGAQGEQPVTIEQTGKKWKAKQAVMFFILVIGGIITVTGLSIGNWVLAGSGGGIFLIGVVSLIVVTIQSWWHHG